MPSLAIAPILKAMKAALAQPTEANIFALADAANLTIKKESLTIEVVEHTTQKGKVIRGVVRTDLSYAEAKAIDEYTFKKDGGWFIREKHLGVDTQNESVEQASTVTPQNEPVTTLQSDTLVKDEDNNIKGLERKFKPASKKYKNPEINLEPKESAKLLKKTLTKLFPDTKFKVGIARGTAYGSVNVSWTDGASRELVKVIAEHFKGSRFNSSDDSTVYLHSLNEDGKIVDYKLSYIGLSRTYTREFLEKIKAAQHINMDGVVIVEENNSAWFKVNNEESEYTESVLNRAKALSSTSKYNFGNVPQAENDESEDFTLSSQSEAERLAKENEIKLIEQQKREAEEKARLKAQADKELNDFRLSGSSLPSDVAASYGQGDMFVTTRKQKQTGENNVPSTSNAMESDSDNAIGANQQQSVENGNDDESAKLGRMARPPVNGLDARGGSERDSSTSLSENDGIGIGARGDTVVSDGAGQRGARVGNTTTQSSRGSRTNEPRTPNERSRDSAIVRTSTRTGSVTQNEKEAAQLKAEGTPTQWGDTANIDKALPYLLPEQRDDVAKLEKRLIEDNKNGMLFTNGTGTGKTFTGLGAVKRFANAGKKNILIVSMNDKIIRDFVKSAKA
ncbi:MAG TPA: DEAD/DEAH box helicase family protein, partial [Acinetobacter sp.]|nr:DEAD/DEAH box helicase family protein [Acinetobacter sp.]